ncbi:MAG: hypothetical protein GQ569_09650 [Methylococcaceae bacterium]|nr:hypothetical protein [Methylococcaceae bacterium]
MIKLQQIIILLFFITFTNQVAAYGTSSSKKACKKPTFSEFSPPKLTEVKPQSEFSFIASSTTDPKSIKVTVKEQSVVIKVSEKGNKYLVTGKLPSEIKGSHARVKIEATGTNRCKGDDGWLLKMESTEK